MSSGPDGEERRATRIVRRSCPIRVDSVIRQMPDRQAAAPAPSAV